MAKPRTSRTSPQRRTTGIGRLRVSNVNRNEAPGKGGSRSQRVR